MQNEIKELITLTKSLKEKYKQYNKSFTLDGKLVGDIGEVLAAERYDLILLPENTKIYDAIDRQTGRKIQIKTSLKGNFYFPCGQEKLPDYFLALQILEDGTLIEFYNGPGIFVLEKYIKPHQLKPYKNLYYTLSKGILEKLNTEVPSIEKIKEI